MHVTEGEAVTNEAPAAVVPVARDVPALPLPQPAPPSEVFWGNAREIGITAVGLFGFAGLVYEYTYLHQLGIDFAAVDISPSLSLIAMSKVAVSNALWIAIVLGVVAVGRFYIERLAYGLHEDGKLDARMPQKRLFQAMLVIGLALTACIMAYGTAMRSVADLRNRRAFNVHVTFKENLNAYAARLLKANAVGDLFLVFNTSDHVFVLDQIKASAAIPNILPIGTVYEIRKDEILSIETYVPSIRKL